VNIPELFQIYVKGPCGYEQLVREEQEEWVEAKI
jgi:hypothetical protein